MLQLDTSMVRYVSEVSAHVCCRLQIYQEVIHDLLNPHGRDMKIREHPQLGM